MSKRPGKMHASVLFNADGTINTKGGEGKLLRWFRARPHGPDPDRPYIDASKWITTWELKVTHVHEHRVTDAPTRKSGIIGQVHPRREWIEHKRAGRDHYYRHVWTRGKLPTTYGPDDDARLQRRLQELGQGIRIPPAATPSPTRPTTASATGRLFDDSPYSC